VNYLKICQTVDTLSGVQGTINDTENSVGIQAVITESVKEAWLFIQNYRRFWTFMIDRVNFNTIQGQEIYTPEEVFTNEDEVDLGVYLKDQVFHDHKNIRYVHPEDFPYIDNSQEGRVTWFTVEPSSNNLHISLPDDNYRLDLYYTRDSQILEASTDVPKLPKRYHQLIVYKALETFSTYLGNPELHAKSAQQSDILMGGLMREFISQKSVRLGGGIA
jgi:hypothetical protein